MKFIFSRLYRLGCLYTNSDLKLSDPAKQEQLKKRGSDWYKTGLLLYSVITLFLILTMIKPNTGVSARAPWQLIVNHTKKECANIYIGFRDDDPESCSVPKGWERADYDDTYNFVCPKGYKKIGMFEGEQCLKLSQKPQKPPHPPQRSNSGGFGCAPIPH